MEDRLPCLGLGTGSGFGSGISTGSGTWYWLNFECLMLNVEMIALLKKQQVNGLLCLYLCGMPAIVIKDWTFYHGKQECCQSFTV